MEQLTVELGFKVVPREYTGDGENISPPITIKGAKGKYLAIIMEDPDAPIGLWVHWVIWNIPTSGSIPRAIPQGGTVTGPISANQGTNTGKEVGYDGPYPPAGRGPHRYFFKVYSLNEKLNLPSKASKKELEEAMAGKIVQYGEAMATYERN
ncbi:MAG: putative kinase inhibitor [Methanomassiliicoccales archaeon PtaU1.Bin124]|nr:MAG: putative kinase inhibitor [Methanomassiliicoccales archaeon PtaU1.Bin124]